MATAMVSDTLSEHFPTLASRLPRQELANLPTPLQVVPLPVDGESHRIAVKYDNLTGSLYGGNKVRKLEYIFPRARERHCLTIATFGAAGSNHALATALYARKAGYDCVCFLSHQAKSPRVAATLNRHIQNGTTLVRYGGSYHNRIETLRRNLWGTHCWVVPMGGSSWLGTIGFVSAALELADQLRRHKLATPERIYVGTGTMGTAAGLALGLALAGLNCEVQAVRVSDTWLTNERALNRLLGKTAAMMHRYDPSVPADLAARVRIRLREAFFGPGYAESTPAADEAIGIAERELDLVLEPTYTGKTLACMIADLRARRAGRQPLYWHTFHSVSLDVPTDRPLDTERLPAEFTRYFPAA